VPFSHPSSPGSLSLALLSSWHTLFLVFAANRPAEALLVALHSSHHIQCNDLAVCACSPEGQVYPGLCKKEHGQQVEEGDSAPLLCSCETPVWSTTSNSEVPSTSKAWTS